MRVIATLVSGFLAYSEQINQKQHNLLDLLPKNYAFTQLAPVESQQVQFRNKAKMVVSGSVEKPILGLRKPEGKVLIYANAHSIPLL